MDTVVEKVGDSALMRLSGRFDFNAHRNFREAVDKAFPGGIVALREMDLSVHEGDFISLLGPSGCGKSTALRLIAGLMRPTRGAIRWQGAAEIGVVVAAQQGEGTALQVV